MEPADAIRSGADEDFRGAASGTLVAFGYLCFETVDRVATDEIDSATAETASSHARPVNTVDFGCKVDHKIQFAAAYLEIIAQAGMGFLHQEAELHKVMLSKSIRS